MKKIIMFAMSLILSVGLFVGCSNIESDLYDTFNIYLDGCIESIKIQDTNDGKDYNQNVAIKVIEETTFKITDIDIKGNTAQATIEITNKNYNRILYRAQTIALNNIPLYASDETIELYYTDATWESYKNEEEETRKGTIYFIKVNDEWIIDSDKTNLSHIVLGGE